jgi:hypothetical protein
VPPVVNSSSSSDASPSLNVHMARGQVSASAGTELGGHAGRPESRPASPYSVRDSSHSGEASRSPGSHRQAVLDVLNTMHDALPVNLDRCWLCGSEACWVGLRLCAEYERLTGIPRQHLVCVRDGLPHSLSPTTCPQLQSPLGRCVCMHPYKPLLGVQFHSEDRSSAQRGLEMQRCKKRGDRNKGLLCAFAHAPALRSRFLERYRHLVSSEGDTLPPWLHHQGRLTSDDVDQMFAWLHMQCAGHHGVLHLDLVLAFLFQDHVVADVKMNLVD